jgi:ABC-type transport system involved in multi-copper enzyme maturation permease subunit
LLPDGANPVYDKEIHSEIFSHGTLMLRVVIQVSILLALPLMAFCLFIVPQYAAWYIGYVVLFNVLVGPVFSANSVAGERERQTLDLLLTTTITPWQMLWGKLVAGLRVSSVLTFFLVWPMLLACLMVDYYWSNFAAVGAYILIILLTCLTTSQLAMLCSSVFRKTSASLIAVYVVVIVLYGMPLVVGFFGDTFYPNDPATESVRWLRVSSPFAAAHDVPVELPKALHRQSVASSGSWPRFGAFVWFTTLLNVAFFATMMWLFTTRWRVAE